MTPLRWIRNLIARRQMERDLTEEMALHIDEKIEELVRQGVPRPAAVTAARRTFGSVIRLREESQDVWRWRAFHDFAGDLRYAVRQLRRTPSFAIAAIVTLALGIGANTAIFSIVDGIVFRPLPFRAPESLVSVESMDMRGPRPTSLSYYTFFEFRRAEVFERIASYRDFGVTLTTDEGPVRLDGMMVSCDLFDVLGVTPRLGRGFIPADEAAGARVVVLSHDVWQSRFGADPGIVGRSISIDEEPNTVVGVAPAGFTFPIRSRPVQIWTTLARDASSATLQPVTEQRGARMLSATARLRAGTSLQESRARLDAVAARLAAENPSSHKNLPATYVRPELDRIVGNASAPIMILWGAVALVLLIACANIANMLLARTADRQHELRVRVAIGGSRSRVVRQLVTENLAIAVIGASAGIAGASVFVRVLMSAVADQVPRAQAVSVDGRVLAFTVALAVTVAILVSLPPALSIRRTVLGGSTGAGSRGSTGNQERVRGALVVAQVSIGVMLLCVASVLSAGFINLVRRDLGFTPENLFTFRIELPGVRYSTGRQIEFIDRLLEQLRTAPGVQSAAVGLPLPLTGNQMGIAFDIEERPTNPSARPTSNMALVSPGYFRAIGTPVIEGREFADEDDGRHSRVLVVNKAFAEHFFPGQRAIGKRIASGATSDRDPSGTKVFREIVGVVGNARQMAHNQAPDPIYYLPYKQLPWGPPSVLVRSSLPAAAILPEVRRIVASLDPQVPVHSVKTLDAMLAGAMAAPRVLTMLMGSFAVIGLVLTATGLYGLLAYAVSKRAREIGVRMALGATPGSIVKMVLARAMKLIAIGAAIGGAGAFAGTMALERTAFGLGGRQPLAWLAVAVAVVALTAVAAAYPPARRAASIDPTAALRAE
jgi:predicted permease